MKSQNYLLTEEDINLLAKALIAYKIDLKSMDYSNNDEAEFSLVELLDSEKVAKKLGLTKNNYTFESEYQNENRRRALNLL